MQKTAVFYVYVIFWERWEQAGVENGAMLITYYLFRYTSECTISQSNFPNFPRLRRQGGIDPPNQKPADVPECSEFSHGSRGRKLKQNSKPTCWDVTGWRRKTRGHRSKCVPPWHRYALSRVSECVDSYSALSLRTLMCRTAWTAYSLYRGRVKWRHIIYGHDTCATLWV